MLGGVSHSYALCLATMPFQHETIMFASTVGAAFNQVSNQYETNASCAQNMHMSQADIHKLISLPRTKKWVHLRYSALCTST